MEAWEIVALVVALVFLVAMLLWALMRARGRRDVQRFEFEAVQRQEIAADREAEAEAIRTEGVRERRLAEQAAERAREMQREADARAERAMERESEAEVVRSEADEQLARAEAARLEAEHRRSR